MKAPKYQCGQLKSNPMWCVHREFSYESPGERMLKIGPQLQKKWYLKMYGFYWATLYSVFRKFVSHIPTEVGDSTLLRTPEYWDGRLLTTANVSSHAAAVTQCNRALSLWHKLNLCILWCCSVKFQDSSVGVGLYSTLERRPRLNTDSIR